MLKGLRNTIVSVFRHLAFLKKFCFGDKSLILLSVLGRLRTVKLSSPLAWLTSLQVEPNKSSKDRVQAES
ncbi:hypothetical protein [uncultured Helicobacter sp.]|uniref:hypothetical protein n=1 Tax=uncultured Helicobacter sp. TaxID=175537 RepID=UPI00374F8B80